MTEELSAGGWTHEQTVAVMLDMAVRSGADWGCELFFTLSDAFDPSAPPELREWAIKVAGTATLRLVDNTEKVADFLGLEPERRRRLIEDRVGACRGRIMDLATRITVGGRA